MAMLPSAGSLLRLMLVSLLVTGSVSEAQKLPVYSSWSRGASSAPGTLFGSSSQATHMTSVTLFGGARERAVMVLRGTGGGTLRVYKNLDHGRLEISHEIYTSDSPTWIGTHDLDQDGREDLMIADPNLGSGQGRIRIHRTLPGGNFANEVAVTMGGEPGMVTSADFDLDGFPDLVSCNWNTQDMSIRLGQTPGVFGGVSFGPVVSFGTVLDGVGIVTGDFDEDSFPDIVISDADANEILYFRGLGDGTFAAQQTLLAFANPAVSIAGDLNFDGHLDLVVPSFSAHELRVLLGAGDGTFQTGTSVPLDSETIFVEIVDFDEDGLPDLITGSEGVGVVPRFRGLGDGTFVPAQPIPTMESPHFVRYLDVDNDGREDLVACGHDPLTDGPFWTIATHLALGDGRAQPLAAADFRDVGELELADLNQDGVLDLIGLDLAPVAVTVGLGLGDGSFSPAVLHASGLGQGRALEVGDVDADGALDAVVLVETMGLGELQVYFDASNASPPAPVITTLSANPTSLALGDWNLDGSPDALVGFTDLTVRLLEGQGDGTFVEVGSAVMPQEPTVIALGDLDADGDFDALVAQVSVAPMGARSSVLEGLGALGFGGVIDAITLNTASFVDVELARVDEDSTLDLVIASVTLVYFAAGQGDLTFGQQNSVATGDAITAFEVFDGNEDGLSDVVYADQGVHLAPGTHQGFFTFSQESSYLGSASTLAAGDVDSDGRIDAVLGGTGEAAVFLNRATFAGRTHDVSVVAGGSQVLDLDLGPAWAGSFFQLAGSDSGIRPGFVIFGQRVPLNPDGYTLELLSNPSPSYLQGTPGLLDSEGRGQITLTIPPGNPSLAGIELHHLFVVLQPSVVLGYVSNPVVVRFGL